MRIGTAVSGRVAVGAWRDAVVGALIAIAVVALGVACGHGVLHRYRCRVTGITRPCDMMRLPDMWGIVEETSAFLACLALKQELVKDGAIDALLACDPKECVDLTPDAGAGAGAPSSPSSTPQAAPPGVGGGPVGGGVGAGGGDGLPDPGAFCCGACEDAGMCAGAPADNECQACAASSCCDAWTACQTDENCQCWIACVAVTGSADVCAEAPGTDPNGATTCGPKDGTTGPLDGCLLTSCVAACGVTPPAPPPALGEGAADDATTLLGGLR